MAEFDDERIASPKQRRKAAGLDRFLTFAGLALAGASAFFPWYVFFNEDKFGINVAASDNSRELPDWPARNVFSVSPLAMSTVSHDPRRRSTKSRRDKLERQTNGAVDELWESSLSACP